MYELLKSLKDSGKTKSYMLPGYSEPISASITSLDESKAVLSANLNGAKVEIFAHPNALIIIQNAK